MQATRSTGRWPRGPVAFLLALAYGFSMTAAPAATAAEEKPRPPYRNILSDKAEYHGPERQDPDPQTLHEIAIGLFAPRDRENPVGRNLWRGATLAIEKANAEGGYKGKPFRLVNRWADDPWGAGSKQMTALVYSDKVWAVIGSLDGAATHVAEQVATRARIVLLTPLSGDPTLTHTAVPWMFRLPPDDASVAEVIARLAIKRMGYRRIIVLSSADHDGRTGAVEIASALRLYQTSPLFHLTFDRRQSDFRQQIERVCAANAHAVVLWGTPEASARLLRTMRERGIALPVFGPAVFSLPAFLQQAGESAEGLTTCRLTWAGDEARWASFAEDYKARFGEDPSDDAALGYDAAVITIAAVRSAGLNRARIRDAVADMSGFAGVGGAVRWDNGGGNVARARPVRVQNGRLIEIEMPNE